MAKAVVSAIAVLIVAVGCSGPSAITTWTFRTDRPWLAGDSEARTPAVDGELAYFCGGYWWDDKTALHAISLRDGRVRWTHRVGRCQGAPLLIDGTLIVYSRETSDAPCTLQGYEPKTGALKWRRQFGEGAPAQAEKCALTTAAAGDQILFASARGDTIESMAAGDGKRERFTFPEPPEHRVWLTTAEGSAWFGFGTQVWSWTPGRSQPDGWPALEVKADPSTYAAVDGGMLFVGGGKPSRLRAFDLASGALRWEQNTFPEILSLTVIDHKVFVNIWRKRFELVSVDRATGRELWSAGDGGFHSPTMLGGRIYADGHESVFAADPATGKILGTFGVGEEVTTTPAVAGDLLLFGTIDGALHAIRRDRLNQN